MFCWQGYDTAHCRLYTVTPESFVHARVYSVHTHLIWGNQQGLMATKSNTFQANLPKKGNRKESKRNNIPILKRPRKRQV